MTPKKKSYEEPIIAIICLILILYITLHIAIAYEITKTEIAQGQIESTRQIFETISKTAEHLNQSPWEIYINEYTGPFLLRALWVWFIIFLMYMSSKKNYIHGKEYGTARWGTQNDIQDLFSSTILKKEIEKAKKLRTPWGKFFIKRELLKQCEKNGKMLLKIRLENAKAHENERKYDNTSNAKLYHNEIDQIKKDTKEEIKLSKIDSWKPDKYRTEFKREVEEVRQNNFLNDEEKEERCKQAQERYRRNLKNWKNTGLQIERLKEKYSNADMILTESERICFYNYKLNNNTLIIGGSGSGKTRGYVLPNVLQAHSSYIITDPKGEILEKAGYFLEKIKRYKIRVLNLDEKRLSDGYNPFKYIHPERPGYEERVLSLIETIILNTDGGQETNNPDPFWPKAERLFLQAIFFFTCDGFVPEERNMTTVMRLIAMLDIAEDEDNYDSDLDYFAKMFEERFGSEHIGVLQYKEFRSKSSGKTAKSIVISAVARLAPFRTSEVRRIFTYDTMALDRVGEEKMAIFVVTPPTDKSFNFIAGMLFTQLFQELQYCATQVHKHDGQRLPVPCRFILDEYANTAQIPNFVQILAYARSFGIGITVILQSLEQIKGMHEKEWGVIVDNCNSILFLGSVTHGDTLKYMSDLLGKGTFDKKTTGRTRGRHGTSSYNDDVIGRELMDPSEIRRLPKEDCLLIVGGRHPFYSKKYDYKSHPNYSMTSDGNETLSYEYTPQPIPTPDKKNLDKNLSHGEKEAGVVVPDKESVVEVKGIQYEEEQSLAENIRIMASIVKNAEMISDGSEAVSDEDYEEYLQEILNEQEKEIESITDALIVGSRLVEKTVKEAEEKIEVAPFAQGMQVFGRSFRNGISEIPVGFIIGQEIDDMSEEEQTELIKDVEEIYFDNDEPAETADNSMTADFQNALSDLNAALDIYDDDNILDELLAGNLSV